MIVKFENIDSVYRQIAQSACGGCACSVFILVANEVDAMAAARILTQVLRSDNITYKIRPVAKFSHVTQSVKECIAMKIKSVIMINCGAIYNIPKYFDLEQGGDMRCYILDNHRPIHLANIHSRTNVIVLDGGSVDDLADVIPSDGSDLESVGDSTSDENDSDSADEFNEEDEDDDDEVRDPDDEEVEDVKSIEKTDEDDEDAEFGDDEVEQEEEEIDAADSNSNIKDDDNISSASVDEDVDLDDNNQQIVDDEEEEEEESSLIDDINNPALDSENINPNIISKKASNKLNEKSLLIKKKLNKTKIGQESDKTSKQQDEQDKIEEDIENEEEEVEEELEDEDVVIVGGRRKISEAVQQHRKRRRQLRTYYAIGNYYTIPTAVQLINLIKLLNKPCTYDVIWMAVLGLTEQYQRYHISEELYHIICDSIKAELPVEGPKRWKVGEGLDEVYIPGSEAGQVFDGLEFRFFMYRHWTLFESMLHSEYTAVKMEVWRGMQGENKLQELFSKLALPLKEVKQSYKFMDPEIRGHFRKNITGTEAQNCNLKNPTAVYKSFYRCNSYKNPVAAADVVYAATALLERGLDSLNELDEEESTSNSNNRDANNDTGSGDASAAERRRSSQSLWLKSFNESYDSLSCNNSQSEDLLKKGVDHAITLQKAMMVEAASLLDSGKSMSTSSRITRLKAFRYAYIHLAGRSSNSYSSGGAAGGSSVVASVPMSAMEGPFTRPQHLTRLANFVMHLQISNGMWTGKNAQPLVLISEKRSTYLVVGVVPPEGAYRGRNGEKDRTPIATNFRQLFSMAAEEINARYRNDSFDSNAIEIDRDDVASFVENLMVLINSK